MSTPPATGIVRPVFRSGAGVVAERLDDHAHLAARVGDRLAGVAGLEPGQVLEVGLDGVREPVEQRSDRPAGAMERQAGNAFLARATAASVSSTPACGISAILGRRGLEDWIIRAAACMRSRASSSAPTPGCARPPPGARARRPRSSCPEARSPRRRRRRPSRSPATLAEHVEALVVRRLHLGVLGRPRRARRAAGLEPDAVVGERPGRVSVELQAEVLVQGAALDHVQHLHPAADRARHVALEGARAEPDLEAVALGQLPRVSGCGCAP